MMQPAATQTIRIQNKDRRRRLHGFWLWAARAAYLLLFFMILVFFTVGFGDYLASFRRGNIGASVIQDASGQLILSVSSNSDAANAGILNGDILQAVNNVPVASAAEANGLLVGEMGSPLTLTILSHHQFPRQVTLTIAGGFLQMLSDMHLSPQFLVIYNTVFACLLALGVIISSPLVFFRRSNDWLAILLAFAMIAFASLFIDPVGFGTYKWHIYFLTTLIYLFGMASMILVFFLFPSGHFQPGWTVWISPLLLVAVFLDFLNIQFFGNMLVDYILWIALFIVGGFAQVYRYRKVSSPTERQQTKRIVLGAVACILIVTTLDLVSIFLPPYLTYSQYVLFRLLVKAGSTLPILILELSFVLAVYHYRLWDTDVYINRTLVYTIVTFTLLAIWLLTTQVLNYAAEQLFDRQPGWLGAILSSLQIAVIYKPIRAWAEKWVNKRFYKDRIDYDKALIELHPSMWIYMTPLDLVHTLVTKVPDLLQSTSAGLFIQERSGMTLSEVHNLHPFEAHKLQFTPALLKKLEKGEALSLPESEPFKLLVPLTIPRLQVFDVVGVLALGARTRGRGYSRDHLTDLTTLGRSAGTALHMLELNEKKLRKDILPAALPPVA